MARGNCQDATEALAWWRLWHLQGIDDERECKPIATEVMQRRGDAPPDVSPGSVVLVFSGSSGKNPTAADRFSRWHPLRQQRYGVLEQGQGSHADNGREERNMPHQFSLLFQTCGMFVDGATSSYDVFPGKEAS